MKLGIILLLIIIILLVILIGTSWSSKKNKTKGCLQFMKHKQFGYKPKKCTETEDDDYDCVRIDLDEYIINLNSFFNSLRCLEYSNPLPNNNITKRQYSEARKIFIQLYKKIFEDGDPNSLSYLGEFSREFYQRNIYYYSIINQNQKIKGIPIYNFVKNNDCLLPLLENKIIAPMIHFDTHSDHKEFENLQKYDKLIHQKTMNLSKIRQIAYDIGCFSSYYIYYSKTNFVWINPLWSLDSPDYKKEITKMDKHPEDDEIVYTPAKLGESGAYVYVRGKLKDNYSKLIEDINEDFILSIDVDYFCTNGLLESDIHTHKSKVKKKEILEDADTASFGRTRYQIEFNNPYYYYFEEKEDDLKQGGLYHQYIKNLKNELKLITQRLHVFKKFLLYIKKEKQVSPVAILISDSCNVHLSRDSNSLTLTNDFCPQNLVLLIRHQLFIILQQVYSEKLIPFLEWPK